MSDSSRPLFADSARRRRVPGRRRRCTTATLAAVGLAGFFTLSIVGRGTAATSSAAVDATVDDTAYPVPSGAVVVATTGSDLAAGTITAPFATIRHAVSTAPAGATIVVRRGVYREALGTIVRRVTIQPYPHEQVWVDGSTPVRGFTRDASGAWSAAGWNPSLCRTCHPDVLVTAANPAAGLPDQVFIDGVPLTEVAARVQLRPGTFYVDAGRHVLVLGDDPTGHSVEATVLERAVQFNGAGAAGSVVRGIGFRRFSPRYTMDVPATLVVNTADVVLAHNTVEWSATRAVSVLAARAVVVDNTFTHSGMNALHANTADWLVVARNRVTDSNEQRWSIAPTHLGQIAGIKLTTTQHAVVRDNVFAGNHCNGIWYDLQSYDGTIVNNIVTDNDGIGIEYESSAHGLIAGNVVAANGKAGVKISGSTFVDVVNNSIAGNLGPQIGIYDDPRSTTDPALRALDITQDTSRIRLVGNIIAAPANATMPLLESFDATRPRHLASSQMIASQNHNLWAQPSGTLRAAVTWQPDLVTNSHWASVDAFVQATGREASSIVLDHTDVANLFADPAAGDWRVRHDGPAAATTVDLDPAVAAALGIPSHAPHYGAPPITSAPVPTTTAPSATTTTPTTASTIPPTSSTAPPSTTVAPPTTTTPTTTVPTPDTVAIHELARSSDGDRLYLPLGAAATARLAHGYEDLGIAFTAYASTAPSGAAAQQLRAPNGHHLVTTFRNEAAALLAKGWVDEGTTFRCSTRPDSGSRALYRPWDRDIRTHRLAFVGAVGSGPVGPRLCYVGR